MKIGKSQRRVLKTLSINREENTKSTKAMALSTAPKSTSISAMPSIEHGNAEPSSSTWPFLNALNSNTPPMTASRKRPVMIHRAIFGSIERFFGILIEHFSGKFPLVDQPASNPPLTVADRHMPYAKELASKFQKAGFHCDIDYTQ